VRRFRGWLSPGTVMGFLALVIALGGSAWAASGHPDAHATKKKKKSHSITSTTVKKIADAEIKKLAPTLSVASAQSATTATNANSANTAKIAGNVYSANVVGDGTMLGSIPAGATSSKNATGDYRVSFGRSLAGCTISAAAANNTGPQLAFVAVGVITGGNTLQVFTRDPTNTVADEPFYVQAICPA
jgi:hypothetical protein